MSVSPVGEATQITWTQENKMGFLQSGSGKATTFLLGLLLLQLIDMESQASAQRLPADEDSNLFGEYIGAEFNNVKFTDVPVNPGVDFHFILSFAIDYDTSDSPSPTNGKFNVFWDTTNLGPSQVSSIKSDRSNVKVALSLGEDSVQGGSAYFKPSSIDSWVSNAVSSLTQSSNVITWTVQTSITSIFKQTPRRSQSASAN